MCKNIKENTENSIFGKHYDRNITYTNIHAQDQ